MNAVDDARRTLPPDLVAEIDAIIAEGLALRDLRGARDRQRAWRGRVEALLVARLALPAAQPRAEALGAEQRAALVLLSIDDGLSLWGPVPTSALARRRWLGLAPPSVFEEDVDGEPRWMRYQRLWHEQRQHEIGMELPPDRRFECVLEQARAKYAGMELSDEQLAQIIADARPRAAWVRAQDLSSCKLSTLIVGAVLAVAISDGADLPPAFDSLVDVEGMGIVDPIAILRAIPDARREDVVLANIARMPIMAMRIATRVLPALELPRVAAHIAALGPKPPPGLGGFDKQVWTKRRDALLLLVDRYPVLAALAPRATKPRRTPPPVDAGADPLHDADAFDAMSATARSALASRLGEALGAGFTVTLGSEGSVDVVAHHLATTLHLVPGGTLRVGITERDIAALDGASRAALRAARERAKEATPVREVRVAPFLVSDAIQAPVRTRAAALAYAERATLRLPSEVELEYLLREGRADQVFALENDDGDGPDETGSSGRPHRWGVAGVLEACWAADDWHDDYRGAPPTAAPWLAGSDEGVLRSGFSVGLTQSADELVFALAGLRTRGSAIGDLEPCLRLVMDLP